MKLKRTKDKRYILNLRVWKNFPKAAAWYVVLSSTIIMEGYDTTLIASFLGFPAFREKYEEYSNGTYGIHTRSRLQMGIQILANVGEIIGLFIASVIANGMVMDIL